MPRLRAGSGVAGSLVLAPLTASAARSVSWHCGCRRAGLRAGRADPAPDPGRQAGRRCSVRSSTTSNGPWRPRCSAACCRTLPTTRGYGLRVLPPAIDGLYVGGDWYDAFLLDDDRMALVVGDVVGRGLQAAAAMGQLRSAVRALAIADSGPGRLLEGSTGSSRAWRRRTPRRWPMPRWTCVTAALVFACAGHPPPVLVDGQGSLGTALGRQVCSAGSPVRRLDPTRGDHHADARGPAGALHRRARWSAATSHWTSPSTTWPSELDAWAERPFAGLADGVADALLGTGAHGRRRLPAGRRLRRASHRSG